MGQSDVTFDDVLSFVRNMNDASGALLAKMAGARECAEEVDDEPDFDPQSLVATIGTTIQAAALGTFLWGRSVEQVNHLGVPSLRIHSTLLGIDTNRILAANGFKKLRCQGGPLTAFTQEGRLKSMKVIDYMREDKGGWYFLDVRWLPAVEAVLASRDLKLPK